MRARIVAAVPVFQARVEAGEVQVRALQYSKPKGRSIRPDPGPGPLPVFVGGAVVGEFK